MGKMHYYYFMVYKLIGGTLWVGIFCYAGYFFGDLPFVQKNLKLLIVAIIVAVSYTHLPDEVTSMKMFISLSGMAKGIFLKSICRV